MLQKIPSNKKKTVQKMPCFFFPELQLITVFILICNSHVSWSTRFLSLKLCVGFSIFDSVSFLLKLIYFCSIKCMNSLTLKCHNSFQNENKIKATHSFGPRTLIFKLQQEILKCNDICVSWSSPKLLWWQIF